MIKFPNQTENLESIVLPEDINYYEDELIKIIRSIKQSKKIEWEFFQTQTSIELRIEEVLRLLSEKKIILKNVDDIREYLLTFPDVIDLVPIAIQIINKYLPNTQIIIDVYKDPEIDDKYLMINLRTKFYDDSFMEKFEMLETEFVKFLVGKEGWIQLITDFESSEVQEVDNVI